jgi:lipid A ethanolaminephosphotransferase
MAPPIRSVHPLRPSAFLPECTSVNLQDCSREALVNAYDNSIAYTDQVLASTIAWLKTHQADHDTAMLYVADHGESLGENNLYLHGLPYALGARRAKSMCPGSRGCPQAFERRSAVSTACLQGQRDARLSHDNYFHSVLGLLGIQTLAYRRSLDAYAACASL